MFLFTEQAALLTVAEDGFVGKYLPEVCVWGLGILPGLRIAVKYLLNRLSSISGTFLSPGA